MRSPARTVGSLALLAALAFGVRSGRAQAGLPTVAQSAQAGDFPWACSGVMRAILPAEDRGALFFAPYIGCDRELRDGQWVVRGISGDRFGGSGIGGDFGLLAMMNIGFGKALVRAEGGGGSDGNGNGNGDGDGDGDGSGGGDADSDNGGSNGTGERQGGGHGDGVRGGEEQSPFPVSFVSSARSSSSLAPQSSAKLAEQSGVGSSSSLPSSSASSTYVPVAHMDDHESVDAGDGGDNDADDRGDDGSDAADVAVAGGEADHDGDGDGSDGRHGGFVFPLFGERAADSSAPVVPAFASSSSSVSSYLPSIVSSLSSTSSSRNATDGDGSVFDRVEGLTGPRSSSGLSTGARSAEAGLPAGAGGGGGGGIFNRVESLQGPVRHPEKSVFGPVPKLWPDPCP